jgi:hypothetical protein
LTTPGLHFHEYVAIIKFVLVLVLVEIDVVVFQVMGEVGRELAHLDLTPARGRSYAVAALRAPRSAISGLAALQSSGVKLDMNGYSTFKIRSRDEVPFALAALFRAHRRGCWQSQPIVAHRTRPYGADLAVSSPDDVSTTHHLRGSRVMLMELMQ